MSDNSKNDSAFGRQMPRIDTQIPGPRSVEYVERLSDTECPAITARRARRARETGVEQDPIVWRRARGANVEDLDRNRYVDLTSAFGVSGLGHSAKGIADAIERQAGQLLHQMAQVHPSDVEVDFRERLAQIAPDPLQQSILGLSGSDAVQAALKTAVMHTGKSGVVSFWGGYHGLEYGAFEVTAYKEAFRAPFRRQLGIDVSRMPYPDPFRPPRAFADCEGAIHERVLSLLDESIANPASGVEDIGAVIVEPILGRGGIVEPPDGFLTGLRQLCDRHGIVLIADEIFTGFGRTGQWFVSGPESAVPDVLCVGKAMGGGLPVSAAIGKPDVMASWSVSASEAIHHSTFSGHPLGCAAGLRVIDEFESNDWFGVIRKKGRRLAERLEGLRARYPGLIGQIRGRGMMLGVDIVEPQNDRAPNPEAARRLLEGCRAKGYLIGISGVHGNVLSITPPFVIKEPQIDGFVETLGQLCEQLSGRGPDRNTTPVAEES